MRPSPPPSLAPPSLLGRLKRLFKVDPPQLRRLEVLFTAPNGMERLIEVVLTAEPDHSWSVGVVRDGAISLIPSAGPEEARLTFLRSYESLVRMGWLVVKATRVGWPGVAGDAGPMVDPDMTLSPWMQGVVALNRLRAEISPGAYMDLVLWTGDGPLPFAASRECWSAAGDAAGQWRVTWFVATEELARERLSQLAAGCEASTRWETVPG